MIISIMNKQSPVYGAASLNNKEALVTLLDGTKKIMSLAYLNENWIITGEHKSVKAALKASEEREQLMKIATASMKIIKDSVSLAENVSDNKLKETLEVVAEQQNDILKTMLGMLTLKK